MGAAILGFGIGMLTYDAFSFIQVTFLFWLLLGIAGALLRIREHDLNRTPRRSRSHPIAARNAT